MRRAAALRLALVAALAAAVAGSAAPARADEARDEIVREAADLAARLEAAAAASDAAAVGEVFLAFEESRLHARIAATDPEAYRSIEERWVALRASIRAGAPRAEAEAAARAIADDLRRRGGAGSSAAGPAEARTAFVGAFLILLREGMEAILILAALAAYLAKIGRPATVRRLWEGTAWALAASLALFGATRAALVRIGGEGREALEGATMLLAAGVLAYVSHWILSKADAARWQAFLKASIDAAARRGSEGAFALVAFLVVFREGFETVLFYEALAVSTGGWSAGIAPIAGGTLAATVALAVAAWAVLAAGRRLPLRPFFLGTGTLLLLLAFKFVGDGVMELQEAGWVEFTPVDVPGLLGLPAWAGVHPSRETILAQAVFVAAAAAAGAAIVRRPAAWATAAAAAVATVAFWAVSSPAESAPTRPAAPADRAPAASVAPPAPADAEAGRRLFAANCTPCHGPAGDGDGPAAPGLTPPPADLVEAARTRTEAELLETLARGRPGTAMPSFAASLSEAERRSIVAYLKSFADR